MGKRVTVNVSESKPWWHSKTLWVNLLALLGVLFTDLSVFVSSNPASSITAFAVLNIVLRAVTKSGISRELV